LLKISHYLHMHSCWLSLAQCTINTMLQTLIVNI
jgi:hypothetical protein